MAQEKWLYVKDPLNRQPYPEYPINLPDEDLLDPEQMPFSPVRKRAVTVGAVVACHRIRIPTLEGMMTAEIGDYIIRGVRGEYYPVKPDIFAATYESASPGATAFLSEGARRIILERHRQVNEEHFDAEHDKQHNEGELVEAAIAYAAAPKHVFARRTDIDNGDDDCFVFERIWPWEETQDKRAKHGRIRRLEIAGALIAAEIDRLLAASKEPASPLPAPGERTGLVHRLGDHALCCDKPFVVAFWDGVKCPVCGRVWFPMADADRSARDLCLSCGAGVDAGGVIPHRQGCPNLGAGGKP